MTIVPYGDMFFSHGETETINREINEPHAVKIMCQTSEMVKLLFGVSATCSQQMMHSRRHARTWARRSKNIVS